MDKETQEEIELKYSVLNYMKEHGFNVEQKLDEKAYQLPIEPKNMFFKTGF